MNCWLFREGYQSRVEEIKQILIRTVLFPKLQHLSELNGLFASERTSVKKLVCIGRIPCKFFIGCLQELLTRGITALWLFAIFKVFFVVLHRDVLYAALMTGYFD